MVAMGGAALLFVGVVAIRRRGYAAHGAARVVYEEWAERTIWRRVGKEGPASR